MGNEHDQGPEPIPPAQPFAPPPGPSRGGPPPGGPPLRGAHPPGPPPGGGGGRSRRKTAGGVVAGALVVALLATLVVVGLFVGDGRLGDRPPAPERTAAAQLRRAAARLADAAAARYRGVVAAGGKRSRVDLRVTRHGAAHGTMTVDDDELRLLAVDGRTFIKGDEGFWRSSGMADEDLLREYAGHWVGMPPAELGLDVPGTLAPAELGRAVEQEAATTGVLVENALLDGAPVKRVTTARWNVYLAATDPRRILRIETRGFGDDELRRPPMVPRIPTVRPDPDGPATVQPAAARGGAPTGEFRLDLTFPDEREIGRWYEELQGGVRELTDSVDPRVEFSLDGSIRLSPCDVNGCTAHVRVTNSVPADGSTTAPDRPVHAAITITMTLDGRPVRTCRITRTMRPNGSATASCRAGFHIPPSYTPRRHIVRAEAHAVARPLARADVDRILRDLRAQRSAVPTPTPTG